MRRRIRQFLMFWYDFVVGDDWRAAAGVVLALVVTKVVASTTVPTWWIVPAAMAVSLAASLRRVVRPRSDKTTS